MKKSKFTVDVENKLTQTAPKKLNKLLPEDYLKGNGNEKSKLRFLNHKMPTLRNFLASLHNTKAESHGEHLFEDMQRLWFESDIFDAKIIALYWLDQQNEDFLKKNHKKILRWITEVDNWAHSDLYCSSLARLFDHAPEAVMPTYKTWNSHKNSWARRCSMVGTYYYSRFRKNPLDFKTATQLVSPHFTAPEYYVQKGVGWTIREMYNVYPAETIKFIENNLHQISSIAWVAASEKLTLKIKQGLLKKRKEIRKK